MTTFSPPSSPTNERQISKAEARRKVLAEIDNAVFTYVPFFPHGTEDRVDQACFHLYHNRKFHVRSTRLLILSVTLLY